MFDEKKATALVARILSLAGGSLEYIKVLKLVYLADRESNCQQNSKRFCRDKLSEQGSSPSPPKRGQSFEKSNDRLQGRPAVVGFAPSPHMHSAPSGQSQAIGSTACVPAVLAGWLPPQGRECRASGFVRWGCRVTHLCKGGSTCGKWNGSLTQVTLIISSYQLRVVRLAEARFS